jgi:hypothetical protein
MRLNEDPIRLGLLSPANVMSFTLRDWDLVIRLGRKGALLGRFHALLEESQLLDLVPSAPRAHLEAARIVALDQERVLRWEVYSIQKALVEVEPNFVLLKGAAYILSKFPFARGRMQSDVDILVPRSKLAVVESTLLENGWKHVKLDKYDQRYYREWSHELPPLRHSQRGTVLDVHHNILPSSGRLHPDAKKLLEQVEAIEGTVYKRLCAADVVLHSAAHTFQSGDFQQLLRELADLDGLLRYFGARLGFWQELSRRAQEMDLNRPLFYALRYSSLFMRTPIPESVLSLSRSWQPPRQVLSIMDQLVSRVLVPRHAATVKATNDLARWLLYVRSHWLSMPPWLLTRHLLHKGFTNRFSTGASG